MKKMITVRADEESFDILLNNERLDALAEINCIHLLDRLSNHIDAYRRLRRARIELAEAEGHMAAVKSCSHPVEEIINDCPF